MKTPDESAELLQVVPSRHRYNADDPFLLLGDLTRERESKLQLVLQTIEHGDEDAATSLARAWGMHTLRCTARSCNASFVTVREMNAHYLSMHSAQCSLCFISYPCERILSIHIAERHDNYFKARVHRGDACFVCLVDGCPQAFTSDGLRSQHLRRDHLFPASFRFHKPRWPNRKTFSGGSKSKGGTSSRMRFGGGGGEGGGGGSEAAGELC